MVVDPECGVFFLFNVKISAVLCVLKLRCTRLYIVMMRRAWYLVWFITTMSQSMYGQKWCNKHWKSKIGIFCFEIVPFIFFFQDVLLSRPLCFFCSSSMVFYSSSTVLNKSHNGHATTEQLLHCMYVCVWFVLLYVVCHDECAVSLSVPLQSVSQCYQLDGAPSVSPWWPYLP